MKREDFDGLIRRAIHGLPKGFRRRLKNVVIEIQDDPSPADRRRLRLRPGQTLFGLYEGVPLTMRNATDLYPLLPDKITIYQGPLERACDTEDEIITQVRDTVKHEVGHFFGLSEEELKGGLEY
ncbi:MAG: metallopeptidase family protein [Planctomycetota bacterium]|nr:metallopeptidase family protein [Planctomycetota bacterium]